MTSPNKKWSPAGFWGGSIGSGIANGIGTAGPAVVAGTLVGKAVIVADIALTGGVATLFGAFGGMIGYGLTYAFDDPVLSHDTKSNFLFHFVFSCIVSAVLSFSSLSFVSANPHSAIWMVAVIGLLSGSIAGGFRGVLNNLIYDRMRM